MKTLLAVIFTMILGYTAVAREVFTVRGLIRNPETFGRQITLLDINANKIMDRAIISDDGTFILKGEVEKPRMLVAQILPDHIAYATFVGERGTINLTIDEIDTVSGTRINDTYQRYLNATYHIENIEKLLEKTTDEARRTELMNGLGKYVNTTFSKLFEETKDNFVGGLVLSMWINMTQMPLSKIEALLDTADPSILEDSELNDILTRLENESN